MRTILPESFERIHRSNLLGTGVLLLQSLVGNAPARLGLTGPEIASVVGLRDGLRPGGRVTVRAQSEDGSKMEFLTIMGVDAPVKVDRFPNGGILPRVLGGMLTDREGP